MPIWIRSDSPARAPYVEVFVDLDELLRTNDVHRPFDRKKGVRAHIERVLKLASKLGEDYHITLFEDLRAEQYGTLEELECAVNGIAVGKLTLVHCRGLKEDEDLIKLTVIQALKRAHRTVHHHVPFCLVASSRHYEQTVQRITEADRIVYVGLPTLTRLPVTAKAATAACWLDTNAAIYQALHARLTPVRATRDAAMKFLRRDYRHPKHEVITEVMDAALRNRPVVFANGEFGAWLQEIFDETSAPPQLLPWIKDGLWTYNLLIKEDELIRWNEEHPALHPERDL